MPKTKTVKKANDKLVKGDDITLKSKVIVTDPCYTIPTWCHSQFSTVKPGKYHTFVILSDEGDWGIRTSRLYAIHEEDHLIMELNWEVLSNNIGVDSGQAGIFTLDSYRKDKIASKITYPKGEWNAEEYAAMRSIVDGKIEDGDIWYEKMCGLTLNTKYGFGTYKNGVVSRTGIGDGVYTLYGNFIKVNGKDKINAFCIDFGLSTKKIKDDISKVK